MIGSSLKDVTYLRELQLHELSKVKAEKMNSSVSMAIVPSSHKEKKLKKKMWKGPKQKVKEKQQLVLPPKEAQHFSENWRNLQELLRAKQAAHSEGVLSTGEKRKPISDKVHAGKSQAPPEKSKQWKAQKRKVNVAQCKSCSPRKRQKEEDGKTVTEADIWFDDVDPDDVEATVGPQAADVLRRKQGVLKCEPVSAQSALVKESAFEGLTRAVAMDCEMVGVGVHGEDSMLARVSLVNQFGKCVYDKYVKPTEPVTDYRTEVSGIRPEDIKGGEDIKIVQKEVADMLQGRILVGHAIHNDLKILLLDHPKKKIRDTQKYKPFKKAVKSGRPSLKLVCDKILHVKVQQGEHSSVQDAQATMRLYTLVKKQWEAAAKQGQLCGETVELIPHV